MEDVGEQSANWYLDLGTGM